MNGHPHPLIGNQPLKQRAKMSYLPLVRVEGNGLAEEILKRRPRRILHLQIQMQRFELVLLQGVQRFAPDAVQE